MPQPKEIGIGLPVQRQELFFGEELPAELPLLMNSGILVNRINLEMKIMPTLRHLALDCQGPGTTFPIPEQLVAIINLKVIWSSMAVWQVIQQGRISQRQQTSLWIILLLQPALLHL